MNEISSGPQSGATNGFTEVSDQKSPMRQRAPSGATPAKDLTGDSGGQAGDPTSVIDQVKEQASSVLSGQKEGIADRIDEIVDAAHQSGSHFEGKQDWIAGAIERGAAELSAFATSLRENDLASLFGQVQSIARKQPALFIGASLAAGFAVARFGKLVAADVSRNDLATLPEVGHGRG